MLEGSASASSAAAAESGSMLLVGWLARTHALPAGSLRMSVTECEPHPMAKTDYRCLYTFNAPFSFVGFVAAVAQIYVIPSGRGARRGLRTFPFALQRS